MKKYFPEYRGFRNEWARFLRRGEEVSFDSYKEASEYLSVVAGETRIKIEDNAELEQEQQRERECLHMPNMHLPLGGYWRNY